MPETKLLDPKGDTIVYKENSFYHIGNFRIEGQDGRVSEIYFEWSPAI